MSDLEEEEFIVEKILKKRMNKKIVEYFIKWEGFDDSENTWEPARNLNCPEMISDFENKLKKQKNEKDHDKTKEEKIFSTKRPAEADKPNEEKTKKIAKSQNGFDRGLKAEEIIGATETNGQVYFLIKWAGTTDSELVPSKIANIQIPQMVIAFYESRLTWSANKEDKEE